jgi:hypothetical protein
VPVWTQDVLHALFAALFDIQRELISIRQLLEDSDGPEEEEAADDS